MAVAQNGNIRGTIYEEATGEPLYGVTVVIAGTTTGAITDFDGRFDISIAPGTYDIQASFVSYRTVTIRGVEVASGEVTVIDVISLQEDVQQLEEIVIEADMIRDNEAALLTLKKKSANVMDGISAARFRKIGDSDAASAVQRVTGVSVEGGKYVYVRGLGDRYTKSILNGVDIPGLDPDRNTLPMDIFPTSVIDNIVVLKSFTSDLPSDFVGGLVDLQLKDLPEDRTFSVSADLGYNPSMHFNDQYLTYSGGSKDWLGYDDGTRAIPTSGLTSFPANFAEVVGRPNSVQGLQYQNILQRFGPNMGAMKQRSGMNYGVGLSFGNQVPVGKNKLGYILSLTYKRGTDFFQDVEYGRYGLNQRDNTVLEMDQRELQVGDFGVESVLVGGLAGISYKREKSKYKFYALHLQNGESRSGLWGYRGSDQGSVFDGIQTNLEYNQRGLTNLLLDGTHFLSGGAWEIGWKISPTRSRLEDPDIRFTRLRIDNGVYQTGTESGLPERIWRNLEEDNLVTKIDVTRSHNLFSRDARLKFGAANTYKTRDYLIEGFQINPRGVDLQTGYPLPPSFEGSSDTWFIPEPSNLPNDEIFAPYNLWPTDANGFLGTTYEATFVPNNPNAYSSNINNMAFYVSDQAMVTEDLKAIVGLRVENYEQRYTGQNQLGTIVLNNDVVIEDLGFFPTVNLVYGLTEQQNLRLSYSQTTARPSFKEASYAEIYDPMTGRTFIGGFFVDEDKATGQVIWDGNLKTTDISNVDIRWEMFRERTQMVALSGFYKSFENPIEIVQYAILANSFQPRNVGRGQVIGAELEFRQNLTPSTNNIWTVSGNVTVTKSEIKMNPIELQSRRDNARDGQEIKDTRDMAGQAPYLINFGLAYGGVTSRLEAGLYYNVQGETLQYVGIVDRPDVYTVPFHSLNFNATKTLGAKDQMRLGLGVTNLLNSARKQVFQSFGAMDQVFGLVNPRTEVKLKFSYSF